MDHVDLGQGPRLSIHKKQVNRIDSQHPESHKLSWYRPHIIFEHWFERRAKQCFKTRSWRFGLFAGLYASVAVLISNIALLCVGQFSHNGIVDGIGTIMEGDPQYVTRMSTALHVLINILSTILLTSSNYAMQLLCAPTRKEIDRAHNNRQWLEIGIMSFHNVRHIQGKHALIWSLLALSSIPLHLFYNSAVFGVVARQDYGVTAVSTVDEPFVNNTEWKWMENKDWTRSYSRMYSPEYGDLLLVVDKISFRFSIYQNWSYALEVPTMSRNPCNWTAVSSSSSNIEIPAYLNFTSEKFVWQPDTGGRYRVVLDVADINSTFTPAVPWPEFRFRNASEGTGGSEDLRVCPETGWLVETKSMFHVHHARAKPRGHSSRIQIALPFLAIVISSNIAKVTGIFLTTRVCSSGHIVTVGDAVATFLEKPEPITEGKCTSTKSSLTRHIETAEMQPWVLQKKPVLSILGGTRAWSIIIITVSLSLNILAISSATRDRTHVSQWDWGTASSLTIPFIQTNFGTQGAILTAWLANLPQVCLSFVYFSINRICTSICFAKEWNDYATHRKGLRVTEPAGRQRDTHFLQLPYRWAIPLTITSGLLHWLLSQSLFLVRQEVRTREGDLYPGSKCACGYSILSLLVFTLVFLTLLIVLLHKLIQHIDIRIPPARHCSMVISAACHPPVDDSNSHLMEVQWGVVDEGTSDRCGHCTFTSHQVTITKEGCLYI